MGLLAKKKKRSAPEVAMAATADISFLLLIFFIVSTVFNVEQGIVMFLPSGQTENTARVSRKNILEVKAFADNTISIGGRPVKLEEVRRICEEAQDANPNIIVVIQTAPGGQYGVMIDILDELKLANIRKISLKMLSTG